MLRAAFHLFCASHPHRPPSNVAQSSGATRNHGQCRATVHRITHAVVWPMPSSSLFRAKLSRVLSGRARNRLILRSSIKNVSRNARSTSASPPRTAAGSGTPQCAVIGCPGQTGQTSFAALSQTVKTKSSFGAPGKENSSHVLLRNPSVGKCAISSCLKDSGRTLPVGRLPALWAVKFGWPLKLRIASAMMERAEFPVQRNKTW